MSKTWAYFVKSTVSSFLDQLAWNIVVVAVVPCSLIIPRCNLFTWSSCLVTWWPSRGWYLSVVVSTLSCSVVVHFLLCTSSHCDWGTEVFWSFRPFISNFMGTHSSVHWKKMNVLWPCETSSKLKRKSQKCLPPGLSSGWSAVMFREVSLSAAVWRPHRLPSPSSKPSPRKVSLERSHSSTVLTLPHFSSHCLHLFCQWSLNIFTFSLRIHFQFLLSYSALRLYKIHFYP